MWKENMGKNKHANCVYSMLNNLTNKQAGKDKTEQATTTTTRHESLRLSMAPFWLSPFLHLQGRQAGRQAFHQ